MPRRKKEPKQQPPREAASPRGRDAVYTISIASRLTELPLHTIRWLEAHEFIHPERTGGNQRLFSDADIELLREIAELLERKVNLAGIRTILTIKAHYRIEHIVLSHEEES